MALDERRHITIGQKIELDLLVRFTPVELLEHLCNVVIPMDSTIIVPDKPSLKLPGISMLGMIGTWVQDYIDMEKCTEQDSLDFRIKALRK